MLTYILSHRWHCLAVSDVRAVWVTLCRDRLELEANILPQSGHFCIPNVSFVKFLTLSEKSSRLEEFSDSKELSDIEGEDDLDEKLKSIA